MDTSTKIAAGLGALWLLSSRAAPPRPPATNTGTPGGAASQGTGAERAIDYALLAVAQKEYARRLTGVSGPTKRVPLTPAYAWELKEWWHEVSVSYMHEADAGYADRLRAWQRFDGNKSVTLIHRSLMRWAATKEYPSADTLPWFWTQADADVWWDELQRLAIAFDVTKGYEPDPSWQERMWAATVYALRKTGQTVGELAGGAAGAAGDVAGSFLSGLFASSGGLLLAGGALLYFGHRGK